MFIIQATGLTQSTYLKVFLTFLNMAPTRSEANHMFTMLTKEASIVLVGSRNLLHLLHTIKRALDDSEYPF
jgi:hypothetical protein